MNNYEFYDVLFENMNLYIMLLIGAFIVYFLVFRKTVKSIIDPLLLPLVYTAIGSVTVLLLFITGNMSAYAFISYWLTQVAFYGAFFLLNRRWGTREKYAVTELSPQFVRQTKLAFIYFSAILVFVQLLVYAQRGIPLLQYSRLDTFVGGSGFGIYSRFIDVSNIAVIYLYFVLFFYRKSIYFTWFYHFMLFLVLIFLFLSGSKTALLVIPFVLFAFLRLHQDNTTIMQHPFTLKLRKRLMYIFAGALALVFVTIKVQSDVTDVLENPFLGLVLRLVHSGDTFWYAYPWNGYAKIDSSKPLLALFNDFFGFFRIYDWSQMPESLGFALFRLQHGFVAGFGPNPRHNVFGLVYFGYYGSVVFSFILGLVFSFIRNVLQTFSASNFVSAIFFVILFINAHMLEADPVLTLAYFNNAFFIYPLLIGLFLVIYTMLERVRANPAEPNVQLESI